MLRETSAFRFGLQGCEHVSFFFFEVILYNESALVLLVFFIFFFCSYLKGGVLKPFHILSRGRKAFSSQALTERLLDS